MHDDITDVPGIRVGHDTNLEAGTGCTVVLCDTPMVGGVDVRGGAPATRETDLLDPLCLVNEVHAVLLTGGSAFGLDAASGIVRYLKERQIGYDTGIIRVPIVPAAAIFDLVVGSATIHPDADAGYRASEQGSGGPIAQGTVGGGTGATVGKLFGPQFAMKSGLGSASMELMGGIVVGALVVVNALGDILDPQTQEILAGARSPLQHGQTVAQNPLSNTTIAVVATNAQLSKAHINKVAQMAHDGMAQVIRPAHTMFDGDTIFTLAQEARTQTQQEYSAAAQTVSTIGAAAANTLARAIIKAILAASDLHGFPAAEADHIKREKK
jgi:L-aminopeptidase/D-esterase-like protein